MNVLLCSSLLLKKAALFSTFLLFWGFSHTIARTPEDIERSIRALVTNGSIILNDESGNTLISHNESQLLMPASIVKIITSAVAIDLLGTDFRFKTEFFRNSQGELAIKGWGDPFMISEEIGLIAAELKKRGMHSIDRISLDNSTFYPNITIPGVSRTLNPYNAINGALVTNFNTLNLRRSAQGTISSAEEATPLTPLAAIMGNSIAAGSTRRINLSDNRENCLRYAGELFVEIFKGAGIEVVNESVSLSKSGEDWEPFYTHYNSNDLTTINRGLQRFSNNFIANQLFLVIGAENRGYPATIEKGRDVFEEYIKTRLNIAPGKLVMTEGSGISRSNRVSGNVMIEVLENRKELAELLPSNRNALLKSGTLTGVYNYAGYIQTDTGLRPFVIILNQDANHRDRILDLLIEYCNIN